MGSSLRDLSSQQGDGELDLVATYGCVLATTEVGLGSLLHALHIPLSGQLLSLNQGFLLSHALIMGKRYETSGFLPAGISTIAASLKSLSPAGKKLTPMLAISMQGWLYNLGTLLAGNTVGGRALGAGLMSIWAFVQPLLFLGLVFGKEWQKLYATVAPYVPFSNVLAVLVVLVSAKILAAIALSFLALRLPPQRIEAYFVHLNRFAATRTKSKSTPNEKSSWTSLRKSLRRPLFLVPFLATVVVAYFVESQWVPLLWAAFRPVAIACCLFVVGRIFAASAPGARLVAYLPHRYRDASSQAWRRFGGE